MSLPTRIVTGIEPLAGGVEDGEKGVDLPRLPLTINFNNDLFPFRCFEPVVVHVSPEGAKVPVISQGKGTC